MDGRPPSVVVVGAGALGLCTAHALLERGAGDVVVIDRLHVAGASSGLSVGIIETQYLEPLAIAVRVRSMERFAQLEREHALPVVRNGYLRTAHDDGALEAFARSVDVQRGLGVRDAVVLDREDVGRLVPDMDVADIAGGLYGPSDGYIDGHLYCSLLADLVQERGGRVLAATSLEGCETGADGRHRLATSKGTLTCDYVVNAAGGWAGRVGDMLGAPVQIAPQLHQALVAHLPRELPYRMPSVMDYTPGSGELGLYFRDEGPGRLVAGLHTEEALHDVVDPDDAGRHEALAFTEQVAELFARRLPGLAEARLGDVWAGIYPMGPDGHPVVGPHPGRETVVTVAGAGGSGLQSSPALGEVAAEWIMHGAPRSLPEAAALRPRNDTGIRADLA